MNVTQSAVHLSNYLFRLVPNATYRLPQRSGVLLTFDDGPDPATTGFVMRKLEKHRLSAMFFFNGEAVQKYPEYAADVVRSGHEIGTHSYYHRSMMLLSASKAEIELTRSLEAIEQATGRRPQWFRPPYGRWNPVLNRVLTRLDLRLLFWNRMPCDFSPRVSVQDISEYLRKSLQPGDIIVLHENRESVKKIDYVLDEFSSILEEKQLSTRSSVALEMKAPV